MLRLLLYSAIIVVAQCEGSMKMEIRSTGLVDKAPPPGFPSIAKEKTVGVLQGHSVEIYCTSDSVHDIVLREFELSSKLLKNLESEIVNDTTRKYFIHVPERQLRPYLYNCHHLYKFNHGDFKFLIIGAVPEIENFECRWDVFDYYMTCSWYSAIGVGYNELSTAVNGYKVGCKSYVLGPSTCTVPLNFETILNAMDSNKINLKVCSYFGCVDQTSKIDPWSILIMPPPLNLTVQTKSSHYALLQWTINNIVIKNALVKYKIEHWVPQGEPKVSYTPPMSLYKRTIQFRIDLPCASKLYVVRVSVKIDNYTRINDNWSDYSYISFYSEPAADGVEDTDPVCKLPSIELNGPVMKYQVQKFREEEIKKMKTRLNSLKEKAEKIRKLHDEL